MSLRLSIRKCPICQQPPENETQSVKDYSISGETFQLMYCAGCNLKYTSDPPAEEEAGSYYASEDYISHSDTKKGLINRLYHVARDYMLGQKRKMIRRMGKKPGTKLLDVGAGTGYFLNHMQEHGYEVDGIEISEEARAFCREQFGIQCHDPSWLFSNPNGPYDVITLWHVLEHVYDLDKYVKQLTRLLADDGLLVLALPNHTSYDARHYGTDWAAYDVPRHLYHFSPKSIEQLAERNQLQLLDIKKLPLDAFYVSMLSEKYRENALFPVLGFIHGFVSWLRSMGNVRKSSSVVYFLWKKAN